MNTVEPVGYSADNAERFAWAGFADAPLNQERVRFLDGVVVGDSVLDAGCGSGAFTDHFARQGRRAVGVDKHQFCLEQASTRGYQGTFLVGDLTERLPFQDGEFDTVVCCDVLEHVDDRAVLAELARVATRRVVFTVPQDLSDLGAFGFMSPTYKDPTHLRYYTAAAVHELAASVRPALVEVVGEQVLNPFGLARHYFRPYSRVPRLASVYTWLLGYLVARAKPHNLSMNWGAVIDLGSRA